MAADFRGALCCFGDARRRTPGEVVKRRIGNFAILLIVR